MIVLEFLKSCPPYNVGECAGFDEEYAKIIVAKGLAVPFQEKGEVLQEVKQEEIVSSEVVSVETVLEEVNSVEEEKTQASIVPVVTKVKN